MSRPRRKAALAGFRRSQRRLWGRLTQAGRRGSLARILAAAALPVLLMYALVACGGGQAAPKASPSAPAPSAAAPKEAASTPAKPGPSARAPLEGESREASIRGPLGGEMRSADDRLNLVIPGGLSPRGLHFKVTSIAAKDLPSPSGYVVIGSGYALSAEDEGRGALTRFARPIQLRFSLKASDLPPGMELGRLSVADHNGSDWTPVPSTVDPSTGSISADVDHFSPYAVVSSKGTTSVTSSPSPNTATTAKPSGSAPPSPAVSVATPTILSGAEATNALTSWAQSTLALVLNPSPAAGLTTSGSGTIPSWLLDQLNLPSSLSGITTVALRAAGSAYGGLLSNGAMLLAVGSGSLTGDITVDVQTASLGYAGLKVGDIYPADANAALSLIKKTYPGVANRAYSQVTAQSGTYVYKATGSRTVATSKGPKVVAEGVVTGVSRTGDAAFVYVAVGTGEFAKALQ